MLRRLLAFALVAGATIGLYLNPAHVIFYIGDSAQPATVSTAPRDLSVVCPGALYQAGGANGTSLVVTRVGAASLIGRFANRQGVNLLEQALVKDSSATAGSLSGSRGDSVSFTAHDPSGIATQGSALLQAAQYQKVGAANLSGLAAANCVRPTADAWLVGGDTSSGRETLLIMANPSQVDSTVNLEILGSGGPIEAPGLSSISVPALQTTVVAISSVAPNLATFAVHVVASGGPVGAWLETRTVRGLTAGGVDYVGASIPAAKSLVIPGIFLRSTAAAAALQNLGDSYSDLQPVLRIANASSKDSTVTAQFLGVSAKSFGTVLQQDVAAHTVVDVPITGLQDGDYVALLRSDSPVRAAIRFARVKAKLTDTAWAVAAEANSGSVGYSVPAGSISKLSIVNPGKSVATVSVGATKVSVPANSSVSLTLPAGSSGLLTSDLPVAASLVIDIDSNIAVLPLLEYRNLGGSLKILVR
jgi:hypothetical protein